MAKIHIEFDTDNAAFSDGNMEAEITRILCIVADRVCAHGDDEAYPIFDLNGNRIGAYYLSE